MNVGTHVRYFHNQHIKERQNDMKEKNVMKEKQNDIRKKYEREFKLFSQILFALTFRMRKTFFKVDTVYF